MLLEICVDCVESALAAEVGGADRLEVCSSLAVGGTTPSYGLVQQCLERTNLAVMAMVRPHDGGFIYSDDDVATMLANISAFKSLGVHGVVFGAMDTNGLVAVEQCRRLLDAARPLQVTFHRAFDIASDPHRAIEQIIDVGCDRLLTSGQATTAVAGIPMLRQLTERNLPLSIIAASGINAANVAEVIRQTQVDEVHASASVARNAAPSEHGMPVSFGSTSRLTSAGSVAAIVRAFRDE